jgi:gliding motility-associated-like protein
MPTGFTPGALRNNRYKPMFAGYHRFHTFRITNRWGQTLFQSTDSDPSWDGTFNGVPQDMGVYFYYIKFDCGGKTIEQKGDCTLIR